MQTIRNLFDESTWNFIFGMAQSLTAILAIIITFVEIRNARKEKKAEKKRKESLCEISTELTKLRPILEFRKNYCDGEKRIQLQHQMQRLNAYAKSIAGIDVNEKLIDDLFPVVKSAYKTFLQNEEKFSMSYGYGRYIDAFRKIVNMEDAYLQAKSSNDNDQKNKVYDEIFDEVKILEPYIKEIQLKFENHI